MSKRLSANALNSNPDYGPGDNPLIPDAEARRRCGEPSERTWWNWSRQEGFPALYKLGRRNYRRTKEMEAWIESRRRPRQASAEAETGLPEPSDGGAR